MPKPKKQDLANLEKIATTIMRKLKQIPIKYILGNINGYSCDDAGNVTGMNLREAEIADI